MFLSRCPSVGRSVDSLVMRGCNCGVLADARGTLPRMVRGGGVSTCSFARVEEHDAALMRNVSENLQL